MTIVLPQGVLYRGGAELQIRSQPIGHNHIDAIIDLPEKVFFDTGISTIKYVILCLLTPYNGSHTDGKR